MSYLVKTSRKRLTFSLLEILITLPLVSLLITTALGSYTSLLTLNQKHKEVSFQLQNSHYFRLRLKKMLQSVSPEELNFKTIENGISFHYNNGINRDPKASNAVVAHLVQDKNMLLLKVYKENEEIKSLIRQEEFLVDINHIHFSWGYFRDNELVYLDALQKERPAALKIAAHSKESKTKYYFFEL